MCKLFSRYKNLTIAYMLVSVICAFANLPEVYAALQSDLSEKNKITEADQSLASCDLEQIKKAKTAIQGTQNEILKEKLTKIHQVEKILQRAKTNYELALEAMKLGDAKDARSDLNNAKQAMADPKVAHCGAFVEKIRLAEARIEQKIEDDVLPGKRVLSKCDLKDLEEAERRLKLSDEKGLKRTALRLELIKSRKMIITYNRAADLFQKGQIEDAKAKLLRLNRRIKSDPQHLCKDLAENIRTALHNIITIQLDYKNIETGLNKCDVNALSVAEVTLMAKDLNPYYKPLLKDFKTRREACFKTVADSNCQKYHGDKTEAVDIKTTQDHYCSCKAGYDYDQTKGACVKELSKDEFLRRAHLVCQKDYGRGAFAHFKDGQSRAFNCLCHKWFGWSETEKRCVRRKSIIEVLADGNKACTQKFGSFSLAVKQNSDGTYLCQCAQGYAWDKNGAKCTKGSEQQIRQVDAGAVCKKQFGDASYAKYNDVGKGDFLCYCKTGYHWNASKNLCVEQSKQQVLSYGDAVCQKKFGAGSYAKSYQGERFWECYIKAK